MLATSSTVCRTATGACDAAEKCTGTSATCPADSLARVSVFLPGPAQPCFECAWDEKDYQSLEVKRPCGAEVAERTGAPPFLGALAAALLNATIDQPGWREGRKVAGRSYAAATAPISSLSDINGLTVAALLPEGWQGFVLPPQLCFCCRPY